MTSTTTTDTGQAVTWEAVAAIATGRGGVPARRNGNARAWRIPSPTGGTLHVEVTLRPRWCVIEVDRWHTTDRDPARSGPWFEQHVYPHVDAALRTKRYGWGTVPSGGGSYASAGPVDRAVVPGLLAAWIDAELSWGIPADGQWPRSAPHAVIPGPEGSYA